MPSRSASNGESPKQVLAKCVRCAMLSRVERRSQHGKTGDNCYVSEVCRSRRSYTVTSDRATRLAADSIQRAFSPFTVLAWCLSKSTLALKPS